MATEVIDKYYEEHSVYRAFMVCDTEDTVIDLVSALREKDYSVSCVLDVDLEEERPMVRQKLAAFELSMDRIIVTSYFVFLNCKALLQGYVLPHQNLVVFYNMEHDMAQMIVDWLEDSKSTGIIGDNINILSV
jgi:hypothetical protein